MRSTMPPRTPAATPTIDPPERRSPPNGVVASVGGVSLTSADLDRWSNRLARMLLRMGARPGGFVALAGLPELESTAVRHALDKIGARVSSGARTPAVGVTVWARRGGLSDAVTWLVLDEPATLRKYRSTSDTPLTAAELDAAGRR
ncbi:AMP-binding protein [Nocardia sp. NPDC004340]